MRLKERLKEVFTIGPLSYYPRRPDAIKDAQGWIDPDFPITFVFEDGPAYIPYTPGEACGRVRILSLEQFAEANQTGAFGWQDILVLSQAPGDIEGVIAGLVTASPQDEVSDLTYRMRCRGTPNAYIENAIEAFAPYEGKLVRLSIGASAYQVREVAIAEAEACWEARRPKAPAIVDVDPEYKNLDALEEIQVTRDNYLELLKRFGGKTMSAAILRSLQPEGSRIKGFAIPFHYYLQFIRSNKTPSPIDPAREVTYEKYIEELISDPAFRTDSQRRFQELAKLRQLFDGEGVVDPAAVEAVALRVAEVFDTANKKVRFNASGNGGPSGPRGGPDFEPFQFEARGPSGCELPEVRTGKQNLVPQPLQGRSEPSRVASFLSSHAQPQLQPFGQPRNGSAGSAPQFAGPGGAGGEAPRNWYPRLFTASVMSRTPLLSVSAASRHAGAAAPRKR